MLITNGFSDADGVELQASKTPATASTAPGDGRTVEESDVADSSTPPRRIQRRRTKGWRMPEGAVYVRRPTKWGNPFMAVPIGSAPYRWTVVDDNDVDYREPLDGWAHRQSAVLKTVRLFYMDVKGELAPYPPLSELRGKDLVCWCRIDLPCHADVLLDLANRGDA